MCAFSVLVPPLIDTDFNLRTINIYEILYFKMS